MYGSKGLIAAPAAGKVISATSGLDLGQHNEGRQSPRKRKKDRRMDLVDNDAVRTRKCLLEIPRWDMEHGACG